jgi:hypothetical protein
MLNLSNRYGEETRMDCRFLSRVSEKVSQTVEPFQAAQERDRRSMEDRPGSK